MERIDGRSCDALRPIIITRGFTKFAEGSVLIEAGDTKIICNISIDDRVPPFVKGTGSGWLTAEYSMLPRSTPVRNIREVNRGKLGGRTMEIQRLIGRSLRSVVDLAALGEKTLWVDCDVIQADGGTRTTAISGAFVALVDALVHLRSGAHQPLPVTDFLAATSVGVVDDTAVLDLNYAEDSRARVDMNVVMTGGLQVVEVQGSGEGGPFSPDEMHRLLELAKHGTQDMIRLQREALGALAMEVGKHGEPAAGSHQ